MVLNRPLGSGTQNSVKLLLLLVLYNPNMIVLFFTKERNGDFLVLLVYAYDIMTSGNSEDAIAELKEYLGSKLHIH